MAESSQSDEKLDLKVSDSHGALTHFKVKKTTKFRKILTAYASKAGIEERAIRLMVDGERVNLEQCPGDLDMENGDQIDAMVEQQGGLGQDPAAAAVAAFEGSPCEARVCSMARAASAMSMSSQLAGRARCLPTAAERCNASCSCALW